MFVNSDQLPVDRYVQPVENCVALHNDGVAQFLGQYGP